MKGNLNCTLLEGNSVETQPSKLKKLRYRNLVINIYFEDEDPSSCNTTVYPS